ncbi:MAG: SDR family oxidoreductase [Alphaproteobacteria bacterium]|nr:SDR family oxidoreductase [Alphaproteobacteria bacterium]
MTSEDVFQGKVAVVTGAAGFIGRAIVMAMTRRGATAEILDRVVADLTLEQVKAQGGQAHAQVCDIASSASVDAAIADILARHGRIDILVNCAGGGQRIGFVETTDEEWFTQINANLSGAFYTMRAALPGMLARKSGAIVNVASISGIIGGLPSKGTQGRSGPAYGAAKAGLIGLTKWAAREFGKHGVRVNAIAPGPVLTSQVMHGYDYGVEDYPIPRMGAPEDMAEAVVYLASPASSYVTGEVIKVTGGVGM